MSKVSVSSLMVLCAALAACSDRDTTHMVTSPDARPAFSEAADLDYGFSLDGPFGVAVGAESQALSAQMSASAQATTVSHASGHVGFSSGQPALGIASEDYSFVALSTTPTTFAAKGEYELMLTTVAGRQNRIHGNVVCMSTVGNTTRIAGIITKLWVNNVPTPIPAAPTHNYWTVTDNGEGQGTADQASLMAFTIAPGAAFHCSTGFTPPQFAIQEGNIQVMR